MPQPQSGPPYASWNQAAGGEDPTVPVPTPMPPQPSFADPMASTERRIVPSPPKRRAPVAGWIAGVVVALLAGGAGGYFIGAAGGEEKPPEDKPVTQPSAALPPFEAHQVAVNKGKLDGELAGLAAPWLSSLDTCISDVDKDAPPLGGDESRHVTCRYGQAWVHFMVYKDQEQKNAARAYRQQLNFNSDEIAPGVRDPGRTAGGTTEANGKLAEYAFRQKDGRAWCGIFWERDEDPLAASMIEAPCDELGGGWDALRDLWHRHS